MIDGNDYSLGKDKRLTHGDTISAVLRTGKRKVIQPIRLHFLTISESRKPTQHKAAFLVPKRIFRKATRRNQIRRWLKEAYRTQRSSILGESNDVNFNLVFIVNRSNISGYADIQQAVGDLLTYIASK